MILPNADSLFFAHLGGIIPALIWLWFWLREDKKRPEPRGLIMLTFVAGMLVVPIAIILQKATFNRDSLFFTFIIWAIFEELLKFGAAYFTVLRRKEMDEPIDALIYMMTAALGFVAIENTLFILDPIINGDIIGTVITGDLRFIGASLLHTISSATIGISIALSFYKDKLTKKKYLITGIILAIALHAAFNLSIINETTSNTLATFGFVWIAIVVLMLFFEKVKKIYPVNKI
jgi:RsiW-degrading membrane proteinase PrsW (M82 family)